MREIQARSPGDKTREVAITLQAHSVIIRAMRPEGWPGLMEPRHFIAALQSHHYTIAINFVATAVGFY